MSQGEDLFYLIVRNEQTISIELKKPTTKNILK